MRTQPMHICVLHNRDHDLLDADPGRQAREDVIRVAGHLAAALHQGGNTSELVGLGEDPLPALDALRRRAPDLVVNLCESLGGDSRGEMAVPCLLEMMGLPFTGSPALSLGLALYKGKSKELLRARGIPTPDFALVERVEQVVSVRLPFPLIVKPSREDASVGVDFDSVVHDRRNLGRAVRQVLETFGQPALVEQYIEGREVYVPLLGNAPRAALPLTEIRFGKAFEGRPQIVSYRAKWEASSAEFIDSPAVRCDLGAELEAEVIRVAVAAFEALDCRDYGRVDIRLTPDGTPYVIDINPNCDLHPTAGFAQAALGAGLSYPMLALRLVDIALERSHGNTPHQHPAGPRAAGRAAGANRNVLAGRGEMRPRAHRPRASAE